MKELGLEGKKCDYCDHWSKSKFDLKSHINDIHQEEKGQKCQMCGKSFAQSGSLKKHYMLVHS